MWGIPEPAARSRACVVVREATYGALLRGAIGNPGRLFSAIGSLDIEASEGALVPLSETIVSATPLIFAGLSVALAFRVGLFNIGAEGQIYIGALLAAASASASSGMPWSIHLPLVVGAGFVGGALWGFIPGILKARTGAHEVIMTIMLNYVAFSLIGCRCSATELVQREGRRPDLEDRRAGGRARPDLRRACARTGAS